MRVRLHGVVAVINRGPTVVMLEKPPPLWRGLFHILPLPPNASTDTILRVRIVAYETECQLRRHLMGVHKVIEVLSQSDKGWKEAAQAAVTEAAETVKGIKSIYIEEFQGVVENEKITQYRVNAKITFEVGDNR